MSLRLIHELYVFTAAFSHSPATNKTTAVVPPTPVVPIAPVIPTILVVFVEEDNTSVPETKNVRLFLFSGTSNFLRLKSY
jgi:hypothetical protein